jgi:hypothetical protein
VYCASGLWPRPAWARPSGTGDGRDGTGVHTSIPGYDTGRSAKTTVPGGIDLSTI